MCYSQAQIFGARKHGDKPLRLLDFVHPQAAVIFLNKKGDAPMLPKLNKLSILTIAAVGILTLAVCATSQEKATKMGKMGKNTSVTGCLQKGDEAGEFNLTAEDGKTYGVRSNSVKLADHVGHKVTITGH